MITKIEVDFALPVELTSGEMQTIDHIANEAARRTETPEIVHWAAGCGSKPHYSERDSAFLGKPVEDGAPESGEPTFDNEVFYVETFSRERYPTEPFKPYKKSKTDADRFCELLEAIDTRCMAADGPVTPTLSEATADEMRRLYVFADRVRKSSK